MKIAIVFDKMSWGGIERVGLSYIDMFIENGDSVDVYVLSKKNDTIIKRLNPKSNLRVININRRLLPENMWFYTSEYDFNGGEIILFCIRYCISKLLIPLSRLLYGNSKKYDVAIAFSGHITDLSFVAEGFINAKKKIAWLHGSEYQYKNESPAFFRLYKKIKNLVCLSDYYDNVCLEFNKQNKINKIKIYNPFKKSDYIINEKKVLQLKQAYGDFCLMVGRLDPDKDQITVIKAIKILKDKYNVDLKLLIVGDGSEKNRIMSKINELKLNDKVILMGNKSDVQNYYSAAKIFVHSSPFEGLPTVLLEAMSFSLPIVTTNSIPGVGEIIDGYNCGLVSPVYNSEKLADNLYKVLSDSIIRDDIVKRGEEIIKDFDVSLIKSKLYRYINNI